MGVDKEYKELKGKLEYFGNPGGLNAKTGKFPAAALINGLELVTAAAVTVALALSIAETRVTTAIYQLEPDRAQVYVKVNNREDEQNLYYEVRSPSGALAASGELDQDREYLYFTGLEPDTCYTIYYYHEQDGEEKQLRPFVFYTDVDPQQPDRPEESPQQEPQNEPKKPPLKPTTPAPEQKPEEETKPNPRPVYKPAPDEDYYAPTPTPTPTPPVADSVLLKEAEAVLDPVLDSVTAYRVTKAHIFTDVISDQVTIEVAQDGAPLSAYSTSYNPDTQTMTVTVTTDPVALGSSVVTQVTLTDVNGVSASSTKTVAVPKVENVELTTEVNPDGTLDLRFRGNATLPSEGTMTYEIGAWPWLDSSAPMQTMTIRNGGTTFDVTFPNIDPGSLTGPQTARAWVHANWSADPQNHPVTTEMEVQYILADPSVLDL